MMAKPPKAMGTPGQRDGIAEPAHHTIVLMGTSKHTCTATALACAHAHVIRNTDEHYTTLEDGL